MPELNLVIPAFVDRALKNEMTRTGSSASSIVASALAGYFHTPLHTLFQVSTSGALVEGVYTGAISSDVILKHGDFGLGTFENLDGEMVVLDGRIYRARGDGTVSQAPVDACAPFAVVTRFAPDVDLQIEPADSLDILMQLCDEHRRSNNIFYALRLDGEFRHIRMRAVSPPSSGGRLIDAAKAQSEFELSRIHGTLVGLWSPGFSSAFSIAGYHFHFLSEDRVHGGHLLACSSGSLRLRVEALTDFHLALPENESFLKADLSKNSAGELAYAEQAH
ncbi:acetolactate decarboxylase [Caballeronia sordidicola]|uniref:acetolactate decarboxylase n=1 Tax=Caballeronia sordidicola TaxID=196367 RepID=UPI0004CFED3D|nr:acetolactate decarboxylase [Caballeronia sordidicola]